MDSAKFAELVAKTGKAFGALDGCFDTQERSFVNMFIGFLKINTNFDGDVNEVLRKANEDVYTLSQLTEESKALLSDLPEEKRKATVESMAAFIQSVINSDGTQDYIEMRNLERWKEALL